MSEVAVVTDVSKSCCQPSGSRERNAGIATVTPPKGAVEAREEQSFVALPGGMFLMGTDAAEGFPQDGEGPVREVTLSPFEIAIHPVTNAVFAEFVKATGYRTEAEQFGWSFVFWSHIPAAQRKELVEDTVAGAQWWCKVPGATWDVPEGPGSNLGGRADHPVVHVSWSDAQAFCAWTRTRLPTEAEWEYAARGGLVQKAHPWGDQLRPGGEHRCNIWQGDFPNHDTADDGYTGTCPVEAFPPNGLGLYSMTGNAWEWCADWFSAEHHRTAHRTDPKGPEAGKGRVMKGGSFLCHKSYCNRYRVGARTSNTPDSSTSNTGFRCAR